MYEGVKVGMGLGSLEWMGVVVGRSVRMYVLIDRIVENGRTYVVDESESLCQSDTNMGSVWMMYM